MSFQTIYCINYGSTRLFARAFQNINFSTCPIYVTFKSANPTFFAKYSYKVCNITIKCFLSFFSGKGMMKGEPGMMLQNNMDSALVAGMSGPSKKPNGAAMMGKAVTRTTRRGGGGGRRLSYSPETDKQLLEWVVERSRNGLPVSREAIQTQALQLVRDECPDFKASSGWVEKFLIRHKISLPTRASLLGKCWRVVINLATPFECTDQYCFSAILHNSVEYHHNFKYCIPKKVVSKIKMFLTFAIPGINSTYEELKISLWAKWVICVLIILVAFAIWFGYSDGWEGGGFAKVIAWAYYNYCDFWLCRKWNDTTRSTSIDIQWHGKHLYITNTKSFVW